MKQPKNTMTVEDIAKRLRAIDNCGRFSGKTDGQVFSSFLLFCIRRGIRLAVANPNVWPGRGVKRFYKTEAAEAALKAYSTRRQYTKAEQTITIKNAEGAVVAKTTCDPSTSYEVNVHPDGYISVTAIKNNNRLVVCTTSSEPL